MLGNTRIRVSNTGFGREACHPQVSQAASVAATVLSHHTYVRVITSDLTIRGDKCKNGFLHVGSKTMLVVGSNESSDQMQGHTANSHIDPRRIQRYENDRYWMPQAPEMGENNFSSLCTESFGTS